MKTAFSVIALLLICNTGWCSYYAVTAHIMGKKTYLASVTKTPDEETCKKVLVLKSGDNPMGDGKWYPVPEGCGCHGPSESYIFEATLSKQPISEPYAWFLDKDGYPTVLKVMGVEPQFMANMFVKKLATTVKNWGFNVEVILPNKK